MSEVQENDRQVTASAVIVTQELPRRVLLVHHKKFNKWIQPGGHVERNETPFEGAIREAKEETGVDISEFLQPGIKVDEYAYLLPSPAWVMEQRIAPFGDQPLHYHIDHMYLVEVPYQEVQHDDNESHNIGWFTWEEVQELDVYPNTLYILQQSLTAVS